MTIPRIRVTAISLIASLGSIVAGAAETSGPPSPGADEAQGIVAIVVTARRREESIQTTPIAVTAFAGDELRALGAESSMDLARFTPGLQIAPVSGEGNIPNIAIRGVGLNDFRAYNESPSAVYVDEVYKGALASLDFQLFDLDRVEVLKGPQGTLFGRNATGGLIQYISKKPTSDTEGYTRLSFGSFNDLTVEAAIGSSLTDAVDARVSVVHHQHDGTERNLDPLGNDGNALDLTAERGQLAFAFADDMSLLLAVEHGQNNDDGGNTYRYAASYLLPDSLAALEPSNSTRNAAVVGLSNVSDINVSPGPFLTTNSTSGTARFEWKGNSTTLVSISNYQTFQLRQAGDCDSTPLDDCSTRFDSNTTQYSQEFHLQGARRNIRWDVGAYYLSLNTHGLQELLGPFAQLLLGAPSSYTAYALDSKSWAGFGQIEYDLLPGLTLTGGLRYSDDSKNMYQSFLNGVVPGGVVYDQNTIGDEAERTDRSISFLTDLRWRPTDDMMLYGGVSRAPKSGTFNSGFGPPPANQYAVKPEQLTDYEVGAKSDWWGGKLRINGAAFYYQYKDYQAFVFQDLNQYLFNVDATATGAELELRALPNKHWEISLGIAYLNAIAHNVADASGAVRDRAMVLAPNLSVNGLVSYSWEAWAGSEMRSQLTASSRSSVYFDNLNSPALREGGHSVADARLAWASGDKHWQVAGLVENLTDKRYRLYAFDLTSLLGYVQNLYNKPRTLEVSLMFAF
jgi:iron complex outermembrane recepter protein